MIEIEAADVKQRMAAFLRLPMARLADDAVLTDLVADSFVLVEMVIELQEQLGVRLVQEDLAPVRTVGDLVTVLRAKATGGPGPR